MPIVIVAFDWRLLNVHVAELAHGDHVNGVRRVVLERLPKALDSGIDLAIRIRRRGRFRPYGAGDVLPAYRTTLVRLQVTEQLLVLASRLGRGWLRWSCGFLRQLPLELYRSGRRPFDLDRLSVVWFLLEYECHVAAGEHYPIAMLERVLAETDLDAVYPKSTEGMTMQQRNGR